MAASSFPLTSCTTPLSLSTSFILPQEHRPVLSEVVSPSTNPIIDMNDHGDTSSLSRKISQACEEYGCFQVINHGVSEELCRKMMILSKEFFQLPPEERTRFFSEDNTVPVRVSHNHVRIENQKKITMWNGYLSMYCHPLEEYIHLYPDNPPQFREIAAKYIKKMRSLARKLLSLLSQGLGLDENYLEMRLGDVPKLRLDVNYYPPCPDPKLTMGQHCHTDICAITILQQANDIGGLQILKDGNWVEVDPVPNAMVIFVADQLQVLSNGRYKSAPHRAITNQLVPRVSIGMFYYTRADAVIGPIDELIDEEHPPIYRNYPYEEFVKEFHRQDGIRKMLKEAFELRP